MEADHRFARVAQDPRFKKISRKEKKLKIDGRFQKMFTDKNFTTKYFVDKRGSKVKKSSTEDLHKFYEMSDESDEEEDRNELKLQQKIQKELRGEDDVKSETNKEEKLRKESKKVKRKKKLQKFHHDEEESSDENTSDVRQANQTKGRHKDDNHVSSEEEVDISRGEGDMQSSTDEEDEEKLRFEIVQEDIEHPWGEMDVSTKTTETATRRLAICNLDWDRVTATDLFVLFNSFKPRDGVIESVKSLSSLTSVYGYLLRNLMNKLDADIDGIYPSQYGLEQMGKEESTGPVELKDDESEKEEIDDNYTNTEGSEFSMEKLRQYQLNRLKYYYAVMECNSAATAEVLYEECDGTEFELSGNVLDLRYIPEDMEFDQEPHSVATELPASGLYKAPEFSTTALHQTNVRLTWDEPDPGRQRTTMRKFKKEDLLEMDFKAYLASSSDEDEPKEREENRNGDNDSSEDEDKKIEKYKQLLKEIDDKERKSDRDQELEITWEPGLRETTEDLVTSKMKEKERKEMTPWESYLQTKKEKRKEKRKGKEASKNTSTANESDDEIPSDVDLSDPFFSQEIDAGIRKKNKTDKTSTDKTKKKRKRTAPETEEDRKAKEELELLLMDEKDDRQHFSLKGIMENEKKSKKKRKRKEKNAEVVDDNFNVDLEDSRFDALFTSHHFAVDPSDPQYRKTKAMETIIEERQKRREKTESDNTKMRHEKGDHSQKRDPSWSLLVKSVKSKTGQFHEQKKKKKVKHA